MLKVIGVRFRNAGKIYFFYHGQFDIKQGDNIATEQDQKVVNKHKQKEKEAFKICL